MTTHDADDISPQVLINIKPVQAAVKEADVLFVMAVERFDAPFMDSISRLESILSQ